MSNYSKPASPECGCCAYFPVSKRLEPGNDRVEIFETGEVFCPKRGQKRNWRNGVCGDYESAV